jgi:hypothetical protein
LGCNAVSTTLAIKQDQQKGKKKKKKKRRRRMVPLRLMQGPGTAHRIQCNSHPTGCTRLLPPLKAAGTVGTGAMVLSHSHPLKVPNMVNLAGFSPDLGSLPVGALEITHIIKLAMRLGRNRPLRRRCLLPTTVPHKYTPPISVCSSSGMMLEFHSRNGWFLSCG